MLLPYPCLAPHHPLSGISSSHVQKPTCIWHHIPCISYTTRCIWYTTTCLVPHHPSLAPHHPCLVLYHPYLVPHHPCLVPDLCLVSHHMTGTPPLSGTPPCVWNPSHPHVWYPTLVPHPQYPHHHLAIFAPIWPLTAPDLVPVCPPF